MRKQANAPGGFIRPAPRNFAGAEPGPRATGEAFPAAGGAGCALALPPLPVPVPYVHLPCVHFHVAFSPGFAASSTAQRRKDGS